MECNMQIFILALFKIIWKPLQAGWSFLYLTKWDVQTFLPLSFGLNSVVEIWDVVAHGRSTKMTFWRNYNSYYNYNMAASSSMERNFLLL